MRHASAVAIDIRPRFIDGAIMNPDGVFGQHKIIADDQVTALAARQ
jgi:hypothetical protein